MTHEQQELINRQRRQQLQYASETGGEHVLPGNPINPGKPRGNPGGVVPPPGRYKVFMNSYGVLVPDNNYINVVGGNEDRAYFFIQNRGIQNIYLAFGNKPETSTDFGSIIIPPTGFYEVYYNVFYNDAYCRSESGNNEVTIFEGVYQQK